jgi:osmotically-inducible protein OsmY
MNTHMKKIVLAGALIAAASAVSAQAADQTAASPPTTVYGQRVTEDQRIKQDVENKIASDPHLNGIVGVETKDGTVTLSGLVTTDGQADRAGRDAESVEGVREVDDGVNAKVGKNF